MSRAGTAVGVGVVLVGAALIYALVKLFGKAADRFAPPSTATPAFDPAATVQSSPVGARFRYASQNAWNLEIVVDYFNSGDAPVTGIAKVVGTMQKGQEDELGAGASDPTFTESLSVTIPAGALHHTGDVTVTFEHSDLTLRRLLYDLAFFWNGVQVETESMT
jgi:hypothetical protein